MAGKAHPVHLGQWGTNITTPKVSAERAVVDIEVIKDNDSDEEVEVESITRTFESDSEGKRAGAAVTQFEPEVMTIPGKGSGKVNSSVSIEDPKLWGPPPTQVAKPVPSRNNFKTG